MLDQIGGRFVYDAHMNIGTWLFTLFNGRNIGRDAAGNRYYEERRLRPRQPAQAPLGRYAGAPEASAVPPEWHAWLHYTTDAPLPDTGRKPGRSRIWPNLTGTPLGYRPPGHDYEGGTPRPRHGRLRSLDAELAPEWGGMASRKSLTGAAVLVVAVGFLAYRDRPFRAQRRLAATR